MGDIKFPPKRTNKMRQEYTEIEIRIHNIMKMMGRQKINPEYSVRHFASFANQMQSNTRFINSPKAIKEMAAIFAATDDIND